MTTMGWRASRRQCLGIVWKKGVVMASVTLACWSLVGVESKSIAAACTFQREQSPFALLAAFGCCLCAVLMSVLLRYNLRLSSCKKVAKKSEILARKVELTPTQTFLAGNTVGAAAGPCSNAKVTAPMTLEQLVPEITHHALSYLDFRSLCCVSMTNSAMRRAANDDSAWKALFRQDFNGEQDGSVPRFGWKAHYAVTKAVTEVNNSFYKKFRAKSWKGMSRLWLRADYVKCIHPGGEMLSGYEAVMENWHLVFNWSQRYDFVLSDLRVRVAGEVAWVTLKEFVNSSMEPLMATNCFEFHDGHWYIVHHHSSPQLEGGMADFHT